MTVDLFFGTSGPRDAEIALVGEAWGMEEAARQMPFVGSSGKELDRMLSEAGIDRAKCFATNVVRERPLNNEMWRFFEPTESATGAPLRGLFPLPNVVEGINAIHQQLLSIRPKVVLAVGNYALWALTCCTGTSTPADAEGRRVPNGIESWRGSQWFCDAAPNDLSSLPLIPLLHPAGIMREWSKRAVTVQDLRVRVPLALRNHWRPNPAPEILAPPTFEQACSRLGGWLARARNSERFRLVSDVETVPSRGLLSCAGFADSAQCAMCIPFIVPTNGGKSFESYWTAEQELTLTRLMRLVLSHPNIEIEGQNFLYDTQWFVAFMNCIPNLRFDSMLAQNLLFPGTPKDLGYLSSLYCEHHWYWKEDGKEWDLHDDPKRQWEYNAQDCWRTFEICTVLRDLIVKMGQERQWQERLENNALALRMMLRGTRIDRNRRAKLALDLQVAAGAFEEWFERIVPQSIVLERLNAKTKTKSKWYNSPKQQQILFSEVLGLSLPKNRKTGRFTLGKEGLETLRAKHPEFTRLFSAMKDYRSVEVFHNTFIKAPLDPDGRMRCMFNTAGTETFRWSSSENAFGRGTNLQNIPAGNEED